MDQEITVAIIGTRSPTNRQALAAEQLAYDLSQRGVGIRTGGAEGVDHAAMRGTLPGFLYVYLAWRGASKDIVPDHAQLTIYDPDDVNHELWTESVELYHPAPRRLTQGGFKLQARNYGILMDPVPVDLCVAMPEREDVGGTAQGIRIGRAHELPLIILPGDLRFDYHALLTQVIEELGL